MICRNAAFVLVLGLNLVACSGRSRRQEAQDDTVPYTGKKTQSRSTGQNQSSGSSRPDQSDFDSSSSSSSGSSTDLGSSNSSSPDSFGNSSTGSTGIVTAASIGIGSDVFDKGRQFVGGWTGEQDDVAGTYWTISPAATSDLGGAGGFGGFGGGASSAGGVSYNGAVKSLLDRACVSCHNPSGSRANSPLQTYALARQFGVDVVSLSVAKRMPPSGGLADADIQLLQQWQQAGFPEGGSSGVFGNSAGTGTGIFGNAAGTGAGIFGNSAATDLNGRGANGAVEFRIRRGTGQGPWNTPQTVVVARVGVPFIIHNDDDIVHQWHTDGSPCPHGDEIQPGQSAQCLPSEAYNGPALYDHITRGQFYIRAE